MQMANSESFSQIPLATISSYTTTFTLYYLLLECIMATGNKGIQKSHSRWLAIAITYYLLAGHEYLKNVLAPTPTLQQVVLPVPRTV